MRVMVFFDLPVTTKEERRLATQFRHFLLNDGYHMLQFSVYARLCNSVENAEVHYRRLARVTPRGGSIRCMVVTEKQYAGMRLIAGKRAPDERPAESIQLSFF